MTIFMSQKFLILIKHNLPIFLFYFYCSSFCGPPCNKYCNVLTTYCVSGVSIHLSLAAVSQRLITTPWSHGTSPRPLTYVYKLFSGFMQGKGSRLMQCLLPTHLLLVLPKSPLCSGFFTPLYLVPGFLFILRKPCCWVSVDGFCTVPGGSWRMSSCLCL